jgi:lysyl-tRNA synthetase class II
LSGPKDPIKHREWQQKLAKAHIGKNLSAETRLKISLGLKERQRVNPFPHNNSQGLHHSDETKLKIRASKLGEKNPRWAGNSPKTKEAGRIRARRLYGTVAGFDIHHKDGNTLNNSPLNIRFVSRKEHMEIDGRLANLIHNNPRGNKNAQ